MGNPSRRDWQMGNTGSRVHHSPLCQENIAIRMLTPIVLVVVTLGSAQAEEYRAVFWNMHSGNSNAALLGGQMAAKDNIDFWGLSEVENQAAVDTFVAALSAEHPDAEFASKISEDGGADRLAIIYRSDRLTSVPYSGSATVDDIGDNFFEVDTINVGGTVRPALGLQLQAASGQMTVVLVNHWKCCDGASNRGRREQQATQMNSFAILTPGMPIVSGGDFNIPLDGRGQTDDAFLTLMQVWEYREPQQQNVGTFRSGSILDAVFVANRVQSWDSSTSILRRDGNTVATTRTFSDDNQTTDHRPLLLVLESDDSERLEELREIIADFEATLERLKSEVARLESGN